MLDNYYEYRLALFPFEATAIADNSYNDQLPNDISETHRSKVRIMYKKYLDQLSQLDTNALDEQEKLSYPIFKQAVLET